MKLSNRLTLFAASLMPVVASAGENLPPAVPEISSGLAPLAIGVAVGAVAIYHEWRKRK